MTESMFDSEGRIRIPEQERAAAATPESVIVNAAYCPMGHNLVSVDHEICGYPGILLSFVSQAGEGLVVLSARLGDPGKAIVKGRLEPDELASLSCPACGTPLDILGHCSCQPDAVQVLAYLYPKRDPYQAIAFCNSLTCDNSAVIRSGEAIKAHTGTPWQG